MFIKFGFETSNFDLILLLYVLNIEAFFLELPLISVFEVIDGLIKFELHFVRQVFELRCIRELQFLYLGMDLIMLRSEWLKSAWKPLCQNIRKFRVFEFCDINGLRKLGKNDFCTGNFALEFSFYHILLFNRFLQLI